MVVAEPKVIFAVLVDFPIVRPVSPVWVINVVLKAEAKDVP